MFGRMAARSLPTAAAADTFEFVPSQAAQRATDYDRCTAIQHLLDYFSARTLDLGAGPFRQRYPPVIPCLFRNSWSPHREWVSILTHLDAAERAAAITVT